MVKSEIEDYVRQDMCAKAINFFEEEYWLSMRTGRFSRRLEESNIDHH